MITALRPIFLVVGLLIAMLGGAMFIPAIVDFSLNNEDWEVFAFTGSFTLLIGLGLYFGARGTSQGMSTRQAFVMTTGVWILLVFFGSIPYLLSGAVPTFTDAFFESMSGLTTTGSTVITDLHTLPPGILLWRGIQQWLGGLGIIVMAVAVLPMLQIGGMQLFKIEAFDTAEKIMPRATQISGSLTLVFIAITALCMICYSLAGMNILDAIVHGMTTVATGGFSNSDASMGFFDSNTILAICVVFMWLGSIPFILYVQAMRGKPADLWQNSQVRVFFCVIAFCTLIAYLLNNQIEGLPGEDRFMDAIFNVTSVITGTGYSSTDYGQWAMGSNAFFFTIMFIGGCAGSTSCGIKIFRFQILFEAILQHLKRIFYPNGIFTLRFNGKKIEDNAASAVMNFFAVYFLLFGVFAILLNMTGLDFLTSMSAAGTAISNVGPGLGNTIGPASTFKELNDTAKWILSAAMLVGRLELFTVLVLLMPRFWRT